MRADASESNLGMTLTAQPHYNTEEADGSTARSANLPCVGQELERHHHPEGGEELHQGGLLRGLQDVGDVQALRGHRDVLLVAAAGVLKPVWVLQWHAG